MNISTDSNNVQVTNSTTVSAVVLDSYDPSTTPTGKEVYQQPLTMRSTTSGATTILAGDSVSVVLDPSRTIYDLIFARPLDLFPLQNSSLMQGIISGSYPPLTIATSSPAQLALAISFNINLMAYPTSTTAKQYYAAVSNAAKTSTSATSVDDVVNAFFQTTTNYKTLTLNAVVTAQTYTNSFAFIWAGFTSNFASFGTAITYYLYSTGTAAANSNQAAPVPQGILTLTQISPAPNPANPSDRTGGYQITYTPPSGAVVTMLYLNGQFVSDDSGFPNVALTGTFVLKSMLTNNSSDNAIIPMLTGAVGGLQVFGTTNKQSSAPGGGAPGDFWAFFHPTTMGGYLSLICTFLGLAMGLEWIGSKAKAAADWFKSQKNPPEPGEIEQMKEQLDQLGETVRANQQELLDKLGDKNAQVPNEADMPNAQLDDQANLVDANNIARADSQIDVLVEQANQVEVLAEYGVTPSLENAAESVRATTQALNEATQNGAKGADLQQAVDDATSGIQESQASLNSAIENVQSELSAQSQAQLEESQQAQQEAQEAEEEAKDAAEDAGDGEGGEGDDPIDGGVID